MASVGEPKLKDSMDQGEGARTQTRARSLDQLLRPLGSLL